MKYMGSKRAMLRNGLGTLLKKELQAADRFVDLFTGSAAVANHVAQNFDVPVVACDLQRYSTVLANAVVQRKTAYDEEKLWDNWLNRASSFVANLNGIPQLPNSLSKRAVSRFRSWCGKQTELPITCAYGGHYFSPEQSVWLDALRKTAPKRPVQRAIALSALIQAASRCIASPGHTAQPFQPTKTGKKFLVEAWTRDIPAATRAAFSEVAQKCAKRKGIAKKVDANRFAKRLRENDLVFIDPPYSGVHYSRFYHVLETIARGGVGQVSGVGRYPAPSSRPRSSYSIQTEAAVALEHLLSTIAQRRSTAILTFPEHDCSNGLSGRSVSKIARCYFDVKRKTVSSRFSSLGGRSDVDNKGQAGRKARIRARELILLLKPKADSTKRSSRKMTKAR